jgi:hypothetical protein
LQAAVSRLKFTPTTNYSGSASLVATLKDSGDNLSGSATVALTVNKPPTAGAVTPASATVDASSSAGSASANASSQAADNVETDLDDEAIQWAGLNSAMEILNA